MFWITYKFLNIIKLGKLSNKENTWNEAAGKELDNSKFDCDWDHSNCLDY